MFFTINVSKNLYLYFSNLIKYMIDCLNANCFEHVRIHSMNHLCFSKLQFRNYKKTIFQSTV